MSFWEYISRGIGIKFAGIVLVLFALFYLAGLWMPEINSLVELKHLAWIIGVPLAVFFIGNYYVWHRDFRK